MDTNISLLCIILYSYLVMKVREKQIHFILYVLIFFVLIIYYLPKIYVVGILQDPINLDF